MDGKKVKQVVSDRPMGGTSFLYRLKLIDMLGREVQTLVNGKKEQGNYSVDFNGSNLPNGIYFYNLSAGNFSESHKMMLLK